MSCTTITCSNLLVKLSELAAVGVSANIVMPTAAGDSNKQQQQTAGSSGQQQEASSSSKRQQPR